MVLLLKLLVLLPLVVVVRPLSRQILHVSECSRLLYRPSRRRLTHHTYINVFVFMYNRCVFFCSRRHSTLPTPSSLINFIVINLKPSITIATVAAVSAQHSQQTFHFPFRNVCLCTVESTFLCMSRSETTIQCYIFKYTYIKIKKLHHYLFPHR